MHTLFKAVLVSSVLLSVLTGCDRQQECKNTGQPLQQDQTVVVPVGTEEYYDCSMVSQQGDGASSWCESRSAFEKSQFAADEGHFATFLAAYRQGMGDAGRALNSRYPLDRDDSDNPAELGYLTGYRGVMASHGMFSFDCFANEESSEYRDRWCEAEAAYRSAGIGGADNPFLRGRYIDGFLAGGRVALTVPEMEAFFGGENPQESQPALAWGWEGQSTPLLDAFQLGFNEGYSAMIASIRESINQVMEQMQMPGNMQLPEGFMSPQQ